MARVWPADESSSTSMSDLAEVNVANPQNEPVGQSIELPASAFEPALDIPVELMTAPEYTKFWEHSGAFTEEKFNKNFTEKRSFIDPFWTIAFYVNLVIAIILFNMLEPGNPESYTQQDGVVVTKDDMVLMGFICVGIAAVVCFLTYVFVALAPRVWIRRAMIIGFALNVASTVAVATSFNPWTLIFSGTIIFMCLTFWCGTCTKMAFSADVLSCSAMILRKFPSIFVFNFVMFIVQSLFSYWFSCAAILIYTRGISYYSYIYLIVTFYWVESTLEYLTYQVCAGVACAYYFLNETEYMPKHPIIQSLRNSLTTGFGPIALAGLLAGLQKFIDKGVKQGGGCCCCKACVKCCCMCFMCCLKCIVNAVNKYTLIYCAMFGVPAKEGVKRWAIKRTVKAVDMVVNSTIIEKTFDFYATCASAIAAAVGGLVAVNLWKDSDVHFGLLYAYAGACATTGLWLIAAPLKVISDTLFVGFAEAPFRMETGAKEVYEIFQGKAKELIDEEIDRQKNPEKYADEKCSLCSWFSK